MNPSRYESLTHSSLLKSCNCKILTWRAPCLDLKECCYSNLNIDVILLEITKCQQGISYSVSSDDAILAEELNMLSHEIREQYLVRSAEILGKLQRLVKSNASILYGIMASVNLILV